MLIKGYDVGPLVAGESLLARPGCWSNYLLAMCSDGGCAEGPVPEWFGEDGADADALSEVLFDPGRWPVFRVPAEDGPGAVVIYRNLDGDYGTDYLLTHPGRSCVEQIARELMKLAPTPAKAACLTRTQITAALKRAGRKRGIESNVERLREAFRTDWARQPELVEDALGKQTVAYSDSSPPPALPPPTSPRLSRRRSRNTRTPKLSSVSPASVSSLPPGCWPKSETTAPASRTPTA